MLSSLFLFGFPDAYVGIQFDGRFILSSFCLFDSFSTLFTAMTLLETLE